MMEQSYSDRERTARPDYEQKFQRILDKYAPEFEVSDKDRTFIIETLDLMYDKYGDSSKPEYLPYHNDTHAFDVMTRALRLGKLYQSVAPELISDRDITLAMIAAAGHDIIQKQSSPDITDEQLSAEFMQKQMEERGYNTKECERVAEAIIATTANKEEGSVQQTMVRQGTKDPIRLIVAMADIQATTMEGSPRMFKDASRLYFELNPPESCTLNEHIERFATFMASQLPFVGDRLDSIHDDLRYYFDEETAAAIEKRNREVFRLKGRSVIHDARLARRAMTYLASELAVNIADIPDNPKKASKIMRQAITLSLRQMKQHHL